MFKKRVRPTEYMLDKELIGEIAKVARLEISEEEKESLLKEMQDVLEAFEVMQNCNTADVAMSIQPVKLKNHMREDTPTKCLSQEEALSQTSLKKDGYFMGPKSL